MSYFGVFLGSRLTVRAVCVRWEFHSAAFLSLSSREETLFALFKKKNFAVLQSVRQDSWLAFSHRGLFSAARLKTQVPRRNTISVGVLALQSMETVEKLLFSSMNAWK